MVGRAWEGVGNMEEIKAISDGTQDSRRGCAGCACTLLGSACITVANIPDLCHLRILIGSSDGGV